ncbi:MAG: hypothetical protein SFV22_07065, partial [Saprospiraceae bacterium]|nr:hypothetical protein [Saprospiraceae bacterium]
MSPFAKKAHANPFLLYPYCKNCLHEHAWHVVLFHYITEAWLAQRTVLLQQFALNYANEKALETNRMQQLTTDLQAALNYNAGISAAQPYEFAVKLCNELLIRHQMNQPMTQALYQQALAMAQQGAGTIGNTASDLVPFLAACDQAQFIEFEAAQERVYSHPIEKNETKEVLTVMPNPSQGWLDVQFQPGAGTQFVIFNSIGKPVKQM